MDPKPTSISAGYTEVESALYEITELGISCESMNDYYEQLHQIMGRLIYAKNFFIVLYDEALDRMEFVYFVDEVDTDLTIEKIGILKQADLRRSATGYLFQQAELVHLDNERFQALSDSGAFSSQGSASADWLGVPLKYKDEMLGAMVIQSYDDNIMFGQKEEDIMQFVSRQIALLIKGKLAEQELKDANRTLEQRVRERTESLNEINKTLSIEIEERKKSENIQSALFRITDLVSTTRSLDDFFVQAHSVISELMYAENLYIALVSEDDSYVDFLYHVDQQDKNPQRRKITEDGRQNGLTERILLEGELIRFDREENFGESPTGSKCASFLGVPLKDKQKVFGVLAVQSYRQDIKYDETNQNVLVTIGKQVATAILRKKDSDSLRAAHEHLEKRVRERTSELEETIVKRRKIERQLEHDSLHDALTGLPNRLYFSNLLGEQIEKKRQSFAVLFLDLDRFKLINDSLGHHVGDLFLQEIAQRLTGCLREQDVVARLGGDEFCILMRNIEGQKVSIQLAGRILKELQKNVVIDNHSLITSASIGIRFSKYGNSQASEIMSDADAAMYQAKHQGKNCFCLFDSEIKQIVSERMQIENDLREAIAKQQLHLNFQPIVDLKSEKTIGCEALVRWNHPTKGFIPPDQFIPIAEETGLIMPLGEFVAEQAVSALKSFTQDDAKKEYFINMNVSAMQILSRTFDSFLRELIANSGIEPEYLNIEITESILIEDYTAAINFVRELKSIGVKVYLDDFGTGFSSLSYLHQFPFDVIKLDKSFINAMDGGERKLAIVESIAAMANNLNMQIVAEGVETEQQLAQLNKFEYQYGQGYYFSKPLSLEQFMKLE